MNTLLLGVNIDHVATLRHQRPQHRDQFAGGRIGDRDDARLAAEFNAVPSN